MSDENQQDEIAALKARIAELEAEKGNLAPVGFSRGFFGCFGVGAAIVVMIIAAISIGKCSQTPTNNQASSSTSLSDSSSSVGVSKTNVESAPAAATETPWKHREDTDALTGKVTKTACTTSTNEAQLDFPYHSVTADLCIRKSPKFGLDTYIQLNGSGQILCSSYEGCSIRVSFNKGPIKTFTGVEPSDRSSNVLFLTSASRLIAEVKKAKSVVIELQFYQAGAQDLTFTTDGLKWP